MMTGHQRVYAWILGLSTVITAALDVGLYQLWGLEGIAVATAVSLSAQNFVQAVVLKRLTGFTSLADVRVAFSEGAGTLRMLTTRRDPPD
jgi:O-antigen/teichoic acid export membrane protein